MAARLQDAPAADVGSVEGTALLWVGSPTGVERELVGRARLPYRAVETGAVRGQRPLAVARNAIKMMVGVRQALAIVDRFQPQVCFVTGGYVCAPVVVASRWRRVPVLIYLPDMTPGLAVRWLSRLAQRVAVSFEEAASFFGAKAVVTGYPVRPELLEAAQEPKAARARLMEALGGVDEPHLPLTLVFGGSRGARSINRAVWAGLAELLAHGPLVHVVGTRDWPLLATHRPELPEALARRYHPVDYLHRGMAWALAGADLVISRAGASILGEFPVAGLPGVLVPLPIAGGHQEPNARKLVEAGGAVLVRDAELDRALVPTVSALLADPERRLQMRERLRALARPQAAQAIAAQLRSLAQERSSP